MTVLDLKLLEGNFAIHRLAPSADIPVEVYNSSFFSISNTGEELSIVCPGSLNINSENCDKDWACIKIVGPLRFSLTGILSQLSAVLAKARISIFAISTHDTDYILIKAAKVARAIVALEDAGYKFIQDKPL